MSTASSEGLKRVPGLRSRFVILELPRSKVDTMNTMEQNLANFDPGMSMKALLGGVMVQGDLRLLAWKMQCPWW